VTTALDKLLEAQALYREYNQNPDLTMKVVYDPSSGYRMMVNEVIFCHWVLDFEAFATKVLAMCQGLMDHALTAEKVREVNIVLAAQASEREPQGKPETGEATKGETT